MKLPFPFVYWVVKRLTAKQGATGDTPKETKGDLGNNNQQSSPPIHGLHHRFQQFNFRNF